MENVKDVKLAKLLYAIVRKLWFVVLLALIFAVVSYGYTAKFVEPVYRSRIAIYVNNKDSGNINNNITTNDITTSQKLVATYVQLLKSDRIMELVAQEIGGKYTADHIRSLMSAASMGGTEVFEVWISHPDPQMAAKIANAIADIAPAQIAEILEGSSTKIIDYAKPAKEPYSPNKTRSAGYGAVVGALVAVVLVVLQTLLDVRIKGEEDLAQLSSAPVLGVIPDLVLNSKDNGGYNHYNAKAKNNAAHKAGSKEGEA